MKYVPCADPGFYRTTYYCCYDADCFRIMKSNALCKKVTDSRDGSVCSDYVSGCPC
jgi:hypothetical protein